MIFDLLHDLFDSLEPNTSSSSETLVPVIEMAGTRLIKVPPIGGKLVPAWDETISDNEVQGLIVKLINY